MAHKKIILSNGQHNSIHDFQIESESLYKKCAYFCISKDDCEVKKGEGILKRPVVFFINITLGCHRLLFPFHLQSYTTRVSLK